MAKCAYRPRIEGIVGFAGIAALLAATASLFSRYMLK
jgi:hypothetical protein